MDNKIIQIIVQWRLKVSRALQSIIHKPMQLMLLVTLLFFGLILLYKVFGYYMMKKYLGAALPPASVSVATVGYEAWQPLIKASGSARAIQGVDLSSEVSGIVKKIHFKSGENAKVGDVLVELNHDADIANLQSLQALAELARTNYTRNQSQYKAQAISQSTLDASAADLKSKLAQANAQNAMVSKKMIVAPFSGKLGISDVNEGQYLNPGDKIVTLQSLHPIYVDFYVPQQSIAKLVVGNAVLVKSDSHPNEIFQGTITAINAKIDPSTRNVWVQATVENEKHALLPGMFVSLEAHIGEPKQSLTLPQTAISYNPYGEIVYVVSEDKTDPKNPILTAKQHFVTVGDTRGDQVAILTGIEAGQRIVTSGQLKLKNGDKIVIQNTVEPENHSNPIVLDE